MKKLAILVVACALAVGACGKKKDTATPAMGSETGETGTGDMGNTGGDAYGGDAYGAPSDPCGGEANPCG
jgi:hypothetical protein